MSLAEQVFQFLGRLHPMLLHAPIGLLIGLVLIELLSLLKRKPLPREVRGSLAWLTAAGAAASVGTGLILRKEGFGSQTADLHQWLGIALGSILLIAAGVQQFGRVAAYRAALLIAALLAVPVGHFGASLTHGEGFLTEPFFPKEKRATKPNSANPPTTEYAAHIAPILEIRCVGCHGEHKDKGGLRLHSPEAIANGGDLGEAFVAFKPQESEIYRRMLLPLNDEDHMPPKSKPQPDAAEIETLRAWIEAGASFTAPVAGTAPAVTAAASVRREEPAAPKAADPAALAALHEALVHVAPISQDSILLEVDFAAVAATTDDDRVTKLLGPIAGQIAELSLSRTKITNESMKIIAQMPNLRRLDVSNTAIDDTGLALLTANKTIEILIIARTSVADIAPLKAMPALQHLYCWGTKLSTESIAALRENSKLLVEAGETQPQPAVEVEPQPVLAAAAKPAPAPAPEVSLKPINMTCPVSGKPIDSSKLVIYKGRVVGLCCEHCAEQFLADPEKFADKLPK